MKCRQKRKAQQYTIRDIPERLDKLLRQKSRETGKSLNQVVLETLTHGTGLSDKPIAHSDLDDVIGSWVEDKDFDAAIADQRRIDPEIWK